MANSLSVLIIGKREGQGVYQTLLVPVSNGISIYHREYTGQRGRGSAWREISLEELPEVEANCYMYAFPTTANNILQVENGIITPLASRIINQWAEYEHPTHDDLEPYSIAVELFYKRLLIGDSSINTYRIDGGHTDIKPISQAPISPQATAKTDTRQSTTSNEVVLAQVPDKKWATEYVQRKVLGNLSEFDIYDSAMANAENVLVFGPTGSGKTMSVLAYASARNLNYYNISSHNGSEPSQWIGQWIPTTDGHYAWQDGAVTQIVRNGGVLLLNEVNFLPERVTTAIFSLLDDRREIQLMGKDGEIIKAHPNLLIVADMNPMYRGTRPLNEAFKNRWAHKLEFDYDPKIEKALVKSKSLIEMANALRESHIKGELATPVSTRDLVTFSRNVERLGLDYAMYSFLNGFNVGKERNAVRMTVENTYKVNIASDFGIKIDITFQPDEGFSCTEEFVGGTL
jgi:nitric oxide reductase NorQ protein/cobaltochelatase CobS